VVERRTGFGNIWDVALERVHFQTTMVEGLAVNNTIGGRVWEWLDEVEEDIKWLERVEDSPPTSLSGLLIMEDDSAAGSTTRGGEGLLCVGWVSRADLAKKNHAPKCPCAKCARRAERRRLHRLQRRRRDAEEAREETAGLGTVFEEVEEA
jgi:hypothetical protein